MPEFRLRLHTRLLPALVALLLVLQLVEPYRGWIILLVGLGEGLLVGYLMWQRLRRRLWLAWVRQKRWRFTVF
jgi:hypothetical protein